MMYTIEFINKIYNPKLNYTVRDTNKWFKKIRMNDIVEVEVPVDKDGMMIFGKGGNYHMPFTALVTDIGYCKFKELPDKVYEFQHNPSCKSIIGLESAMKKAYEYDNWDDRWVTYIGFIILEFDEDEDENEDE